MCVLDSKSTNIYRYSCEQSDHLAKYGWLRHDGSTFGSQEIVDDDFILTTDFVKQDGGFHGGEWTARIRGKPRFGEVRKIDRFCIPIDRNKYDGLL